MRTHSVLSQAQAEAVIEPYKAVLDGAISGAFEDWAAVLQAAPEQTAGLSVFTQTRFVHDRMVHRLATAEASGLAPGLRLQSKRGLHVAILRDQIQLKLKKLSTTLKSRNIQTKQTIAFDQQGRLAGSDELSLTNATGGYVLDGASASIGQIVVVCWTGDERQWVVDLRDQGQGDVVVSLPAATQAPAPTRRRTRIVGEEATSRDEKRAE